MGSLQPLPGDEWKRGDQVRNVDSVTHFVGGYSVRWFCGSASVGRDCSWIGWEMWAENAVLVKRGGKDVR